LRHADLLDGDLGARTTTGTAAQPRDGAEVRNQTIHAGGLPLGPAFGLRVHLQK
jgi:hypothetical protein